MTTTTTAPTGASIQWTWTNGPNVENQPGIYGTQGTPTSANVPGARNSPVGWTDKSGNFWLFGGFGHDSTGSALPLNDLWKYSAGQWTWMGGSNLGGQLGVYGTQGVAAATNVPGARSNAVAWTDASGNFWLFGGFGLDSVGPFSGGLNDLWEYSAGSWIWVSGSNFVNQKGIYGTQGVPAPGNVPGARAGASGWIDSAGTLWLFGGSDLNDLWKYSAGEWTWVGGSNAGDQSATYGTQGTPASENIPGGRGAAVAWIDTSGNFWLFGGQGYDSNGTNGDLNDLWEYGKGQWTWVNGSNIAGQSGTYGTQGTASPNNVPGARDSAEGWTDAAGNLWLFGGESLNPPGQPKGESDFNDLWEYSAGAWTWVSGANTENQLGTYGTLGTAAPGNIPGARDSSLGWADSAGNFWVFGGYGVDSTQTQGGLNDLWKVHP